MHSRSSVISELRLQLPDEVQWIEQRPRRQPAHDVPSDRSHRRRVRFVRGQAARARHNTSTQLNDEAGIDFQEGTPLLPNNDGLSTDQGSNEILRWSGWGGVGGFITGYGEGALAGPITDSPSQANRAQLLTGAMVVSLGNTAISFGQEETSWGVSHYNQLSQSNNAQPFPALRIQNIHPGHLPGILRYLGLYRYQAFLGQLDSGRTFSRPWLSGHDNHVQDAAVPRMGHRAHDHVRRQRQQQLQSAADSSANLTGLSTGNAQSIQHQHALRCLRQGVHQATARYANLRRGAVRRLFQCGRHKRVQAAVQGTVVHGRNLMFRDSRSTDVPPRDSNTHSPTKSIRSIATRCTGLTTMR